MVGGFEGSTSSPLGDGLEDLCLLGVDLHDPGHDLPQPLLAGLLTDDPVPRLLPLARPHERNLYSEGLQSQLYAGQGSQTRLGLQHPGVVVGVLRRGVRLLLGPVETCRRDQETLATGYLAHTSADIQSFRDFR